jgi:hypothetical protein
MTCTHLNLEGYPGYGTSPIGDSRVAVVVNETGDVVIPADLTDEDLAKGPTLDSGEFGAVPEQFTLDEIGAIGVSECVEIDGPPRDLMVTRTIEPPVITEVYADGSARTDEGDIVYLDPDSQFTPDPVESRIRSPEQAVSALRRGGWTELASKFESLGIGAVSTTILNDPEFRAHVVPEAYAGYLFSLMRLNGDMRIAFRDVSDSGGSDDFLFAYRIFLGANASDDNSELSMEARRIISEDDAYLSGLKKRRGDRRRDEVRVRCEEFIDNVRVVYIDEQPVLMAETVS